MSKLNASPNPFPTPSGFKALAEFMWDWFQSYEQQLKTDTLVKQALNLNSQTQQEGGEQDE